MRRSALLWLVVLGCAPSPSAAQPARELFPFVLPWDDATASSTDVRSWLPPPTGPLPSVQVDAAGHFQAGNQRVRFFGVNFCFGACFPDKAAATKIAGRMAKFGINVVRFHHMDMQPYPSGIRARDRKDTGELDPEALARLDWFIAELARHGIYSNLNLLVSRPFNAADGLPAEIEQVGWKERHVAGFFNPKLQELQQEYARKLLTHRNPHTGRTYAEEPAVAFVEINNENGLLHGWLGREVDALPAPYQAELQRAWNAWLKKRYGTTTQLRTAWNRGVQPLEGELLTNGDFQAASKGWYLEAHAPAQAAFATDRSLPPALKGRERSAQVAQIEVREKSSTGWHVQFSQAGLTLAAGQTYTVTFWARADQPRSVGIGLAQAHAPWQPLATGAPVKLTSDWKSYRFLLTPTQADSNARLVFGDLAGQVGKVWLAGVSLRPGGQTGLPSNESLEQGNIASLPRAQQADRAADVQRDWLRFLWETEDAYWQRMDRFLKNDLKVKSVVLGTIVGCSTPNLQARLDAIDTHAYWEHPEFPGRSWDPENWLVRNRTMINEPGGRLPDLALRRVVGKPHCITEYNHAAPNTYSAEAFLLLSAYAGLQDWDALYAFSYSHRGGSDWDTRHVHNFFDIDQHPTRMATLVPAMALFRRGDVRPAERQVVVGLDKEREIDRLRTASAWDLVHARDAGVPRELALISRVAIKTGAQLRAEIPKPEGKEFVADTKELVWDLTAPQRGIVTVNTPRSKAVLGFGGGKRFALGEVTVEPGASLQDGWSLITLTATQGSFRDAAARVLVTATGLMENTNQQWKTPAHESLGRHWGTAPSLVEGIPARFLLPWKTSQVKVWALDERGQHRTAMPVKDVQGKAVVEIGPAQRTLWYEIVVQ